MYILLKPVWTGRNGSARIPKQMAVSATSLNFFVFSQQFRVPEARVHIGCTTCARKFSQDTGHNQTKQWGTAKMISFLSWKRDSFGRSLSKWHLQHLATSNEVRQLQLFGNIREWTGLEFAKSQRVVENREKWRKLVAKSSVVPQQPSRLRDR